MSDDSIRVFLHTRGYAFSAMSDEALDALDALVAENQRLREALREMLGAAAVVLEVLRGQIETRPYKELTAEFQQEIIEACLKVRAAALALEGGET